MPKQIGWSTEAYILSQIKSLLAKVGALSGGGGGVSSLNGQSDVTQTFAVGTAGAGFSISSTGGIHTFNIPNASASAKGLLTAVDWATFNNKQNAIAKITNAQRVLLTPDIGTIVYCTDATEGLYVYKSTGWTFIA
jgi:hypothetical protein